MNFIVSLKVDKKEFLSSRIKFVLTSYAYLDLYYKRFPNNPWNLESLSYQNERYQETLKFIERIPKISRATVLEVGCSIGVFTSMLSRKVERLDAIDISKQAVRRATQRCRRKKNIHVYLGNILEFNKRIYDLIICSGCLEYIPLNDHSKMLDKLINLLAPCGHLVIVSHYNVPWCNTPLEKSFFRKNELSLIKTQKFNAKQSHAPYRITVFTKNKI